MTSSMSSEYGSLLFESLVSVNMAGVPAPRPGMAPRPKRSDRSVRGGPFVTVAALSLSA